MGAGAWTKNWQSLQNIMLMGSHHTGISTLIGTDGNQIADYTGSASMSSPICRLLVSGSFRDYEVNELVLGTGTATPTADDYYITPINGMTELSSLNYNPTYDTANGTVSRTYSKTWQYRGTGSVTIAEWGLLTMYVTGISTYWDYGPTGTRVMVYRELLDTPITLQAYQSVKLQVTVNLTLAEPQ